MATEEPTAVSNEQTEAKEPTILDICKRKEEDGMSVTRNWVSMWQTSLRYFLSDQLHGRERHKDWDWVIINYIWPSIMQEMAKLSRSYKMVASGRENSDTEAAEAWQGFLQWQWEVSLHPKGMRIEQLRAILDGKLHGYRVSKMVWDPKVKWDKKQRRWQGEVRHRLWNPANFWASDKEYINDGDCGSVRFVELSYAISQWPQFEKELTEASSKYPEMLQGGDTHVAGQTSSQGTYPAAGTGGPDKGPMATDSKALLDLVLSGLDIVGTQQNDRRYCRISETYLKDYTEVPRSEEIPVEPEQLLQASAIVQGTGGNFLKPDGMPITPDEWPVNVNEWNEPKYPNGRYIIRCEDTILNPDEQDQVWGFSTWPFVVIPHYLLPHMWQGTDAVTLYRHTQDMINVSMSHLVNNMKEFGDPRVAIEDGAQHIPPGRTKKAFKIMRGAGSIIRLARGGLAKLKILDPVPPSPAATQLYMLFAQEYKNLVGLQDIAQGKKTGGKTTATEAQFLAISANDRIKLQNIFEEQWVKEIVNLTAEMDQQYYDIGRWVRVIGDDLVRGGMEITQGLKDFGFDIDIEPGEAAPYDEEKRIEKYSIAYKMLGEPMPNPMLPEMLRVLGISGWQKILAKHQSYGLFVQFNQLYEAVKSGQVAPQDAIQMLVKKATELYMAEQANAVPQRGNENGNNRNS